MKVQEYLINSVNKKLKDKIIAGVNGPHKHKDTIVRVTAHWMIATLKTYELTNEKKYLEFAIKLKEELVKKKHRPFDETFVCRLRKGVDGNGLIGQAWAIEALIFGWKKLKDNDLRDLAIKIVNKHKQKKNGLWVARTPQGKNMFCDTINQQIWFTAMASLLPDAEIRRKVRIFMDKIEKNILTRRNGRVKLNARSSSLKEFIYQKSLLVRKKLFNQKITKEIGYHSFAVKGLILLKNQFKNDAFWKEKKFQKIKKYTFSKEYLKNLEDNIFGYGYNVSGIELAFIIESMLPQKEQLKIKFLKKQFSKTYDKKKSLMERNTLDKKTLSARIYELYSLKEKTLSTEIN